MADTTPAKPHRLSDVRPDIGDKASDLVGTGPVIITSVVKTEDWGTPPRTMVLFRVAGEDGADGLFHTSSPAIVRDLLAARKAAMFPLEVSFEWKKTQNGFQTLVFGDED